MIRAQDDLYKKTISLIKQTHPELKLENKLIALNVWQLNSEESRDANKAFEKVYNVYRVAKLKGGLKGVVVIGINMDNLSPNASIVLNKDGVTNTIQFKVDELPEIGNIQNIIFNSDGLELYKNLPATDVFPSVQKLITR
jgi:hypothetical protein